MVALAGICATELANAQATPGIRIKDKNIQIGYEDLTNSLYLHSLTFGQNANHAYGNWCFEGCYNGDLDIYKANSSGSKGSLFLKYSNAYVGIGTTNPQYKLDIRGNVGVNGVLVHSDKRYKTDIKPFTDNSINDLFKLNGVTYKTNHIAKNEDEILRGIDSTEEYKQQLIASVREQEKREAESDTRTKFGFIAQELREVYPELVYEDENGYLAVNYVGLIPVLVEAIKELNAKLEGKSFEKSGTVLTSEAKLYQNNPNPFTSNTEIKYYLPNETKEASIRIYNLVGEEIAKFDLLDRGYANLTINGSVLKAGMYNYALLVDGQLIDTKQMVLTR